MLLEGDRLHVRQIDNCIDDGEVDVRILGRDGLERCGVLKAHDHHDIGARADHPAHCLVALRLLGDLELEILDAGLFFEPLCAVIGSLVERLVELAAHVEDDSWREVLCRRSAGDQRGHRHRNAHDYLAHCSIPISAFRFLAAKKRRRHSGKSKQLCVARRPAGRTAQPPSSTMEFPPERTSVHVADDRSRLFGSRETAALIRLGNAGTSTVSEVNHRDCSIYWRRHGEVATAKSSRQFLAALTFSPYEAATAVPHARASAASPASIQAMISDQTRSRCMSRSSMCQPSG